MKTVLSLVLLCTLQLELRAAGSALKIPPGLKTNAEFVLRAAEAIAAVQDTMDLDFLHDRDGFEGLDKRQGQELWAMLRNPPPELLPQCPLDASNLPSERNLVPALKPESKRVEVVEMRPGPWTVEELRPLLKHKNPKVRTLGIMLMFQLNRCDVLPEIAALARDQAKTFRSLRLGAGGLLFTKDRIDPSQYVEQRVSDFAFAVCNTWCMASPELEKARYDARTSPPEILRNFIKRRHPTLNMASLEIALQHMTSGTMPLPDARRNRVNQFYAMLERIEPPRRFFVAVHLWNESLDFERGASNYYLLRMAREVPRELRLAAVFGERPIDDPDMCHFGRGFLRAHVVDLFQTADAERFLQTATALAKEEHFRPAEYAANMLAAADLNPRRAGDILRDALKTMQPKSEEKILGTDERQPVATALAILDGEPDQAAALDWFFQMVPKRSYSGERVAFLQQIMNRDPARYRRIVERIVRDPRLTTLGTSSTRMLIDAAQGYLGRPLVDAHQFRESASLPESQLEKRFELLAGWQRTLTDTVDEWSREKKEPAKTE